MSRRAFNGVPPRSKFADYLLNKGLFADARKANQFLFAITEVWGEMVPACIAKMKDIRPFTKLSSQRKYLPGGQLELLRVNRRNLKHSNDLNITVNKQYTFCRSLPSITFTYCFSVFS